MNRKAEKVLGIIGISLFFVNFLFFGLGSFVEPDALVRPTIGALIATVAGVVAVVMLRRHPRPAGVILGISAVISIVLFHRALLLVVPSIAVILYIIVGIMAIVRQSDVSGVSDVLESSKVSPEEMKVSRMHLSWKEGLRVFLKSQLWNAVILLLVLAHYQYWEHPDSLSRWVNMLIWLECFSLFLAFLAIFQTKRQLHFKRKNPYTWGGLLTAVIGFAVMCAIVYWRLSSDDSINWPPLVMVLFYFYLLVNVLTNFLALFFPKTLIAAYMVGVYGGNEEKNKQIAEVIGEASVATVRSIWPLKWYTSGDTFGRYGLTFIASLTAETHIIYSRFPKVVVFFLSLAQFIMGLVFFGYVNEIF
ncbi:hypothetical protein NSQ26_13140 [Bacillus sp. FSL W7-1360]